MNRSLIVSSVMLGLGFSGAGVASTEEVNVYSYRIPTLIEPMFQKFTEQTGIKVNALHADSGLLERLQNEGRNTPADLVLTVDIGRLVDLKDAELTQPVESAVINENIPENYRDKENHWFGLTSRARIITVSKDRVADGEISSYEDLADPRWKGRICTRSGKHVYNVALTASMIVAHGEEEAEKWLSGVKENLARTPQGNDRAQVRAIREGECDVAVINSYYMANMFADEEQRAWAESVNVILPNQADRGTHMNVSGMAMTRHTDNMDNTLKLMEFLTSETAQQMYAEVNGEYPVKEGVAWAELLQSWGEFKADSVSLNQVADHRADAIRMTDRVGYDQ
jgi:iron(III) transport system substrate-binding protein